MKLRTRLLIAFAYILLAVIVALEVPLALNLNRRALAELQAQALAQAQAVGQSLETTIGPRGFGRNIQPTVQGLAGELASDREIRVIVTDGAGRLLADSAGTGRLGESYESRPEIEQVLRRRTPVRTVRFSDELGQRILATAVPILQQGRVVGTLRITQGLDSVRAEVRRTMFGLIAVGLAGLIAGLVIAWAMAGSLSRPLSRLARAAHRLGEGDLGARSNVRERGEIGEVAQTFDAMADRLEANVRAQREFVANASHQLRTPLTGLKLRLEAARGRAGEGDLARTLEAAEREADRLAGIVDRLLVLARRGETGEPAPTSSLDEAARAVVERWEDRARAAGASISVVGDGGWVGTRREDVDQIFDNLIHNALTYASGPLRIELGAADGQALVAVEDRGPGIPASDRERVLERFSRGQSAPPGGSGLGLAIVAELARRSGGDVRITDGNHGGTRVEVRLPVSP
ncbi:MAG TPA: HAMP domain-containing sensor histidine kinase [Actinomycetota bacterium]|nr:HAMP domain-containing sensor histidine kinase [Actinomycetota bacterium]